MNKTSIKNFAIRARRMLLSFADTDDARLAEQVSYAWFHRLVAIRYMDINGYLPDDAADFLPRLLAEPDTEAARRKLIAMCNRLSDWLPALFPAVNARTEELLSADIFAPQGLVWQLLTDIPDAEWKDAVEIIGWLHQYYNTEPKNQTFDALQRQNIKISSEQLPAVTQLFTPDWIVRYLVDGALGARLRDLCAARGCDEPDARILADLRRLRFLDPCMGTGHILVYAFDVLLRCYRACGCSDREAVREILQNNLYGLDIDERACQLTIFSLMMKACRYDASALEEQPDLHVYVVRNSRFLTEPLIGFAGEDLQQRCDLRTLAEDLQNADVYGSLTKLRKIDWNTLYERATQIEKTYYADVVEALYAQQVREKLLPLLLQAKTMAQPYDVVVTNPPYMGKSAMNRPLRDYVKKQYPLGNYDLFAAFIEACDAMLRPDGYQGMITQHAWMFLKSYEKLRRRLLGTRTIVHMLHLGTRAFEEISGEVVQTTAWIMKKTEKPAQAGTYVRLVDFADKEKIYLEECADGSHHITCRTENESFFDIPGAPMAYWLPARMRGLFRATRVSDFAVVTNGMFTCDNKRFLRLWYEVPREDIVFGCPSKAACISASAHGNRRWFPYNKGGNFCRWYGNQEYVIDFADFGEAIRDYRVQSGQSAAFPGQDYYFCPSLSWSFVGSDKFGIRYYPQGFVFDIAGSSIFPVREEHQMTMLAVLASEPAYRLLAALNPTINYQAGDIRSIPIVERCLNDDRLRTLAAENVAIAKRMWDSRETSWDFAVHSLAATANGQRGVLLSDCVQKELDARERERRQLADNEARIDEIVGAAYGMESDVRIALPAKTNSEELPKDLPEDAEGEREKEAHTLCCELLSYAVGCMFGRFESPCTPTDGCLLYLTEADFLRRLRALLAAWFGEAALAENMQYLAERIMKRPLRADAVPDRLLQYMRSRFFKAHARMYKKRPVYWLTKALSAETKKAANGAPALLYMHRYKPEEVAAYFPSDPPVLGRTLGVQENYRRLQPMLQYRLQAL